MRDGWPSRRLLFVPGENAAHACKEQVARLHLGHSVHWSDPSSPLPEQLNRLSQLAAEPLAAFHVVACGSGCDLATNFALRFPHAVTSLVLVDPAAPGAGYEVETQGQLDRLVQWLQLGHGPSVRDEQHLSLLRAKVAEQTLSGWDSVLGLTPCDDQLESLTCPLLVLLGGAAPPGAKAVTAAKYGQAPWFQLRLVSGVKSCCMKEAPEAALAIALDFVGALRGIA